MVSAVSERDLDVVVFGASGVTGRRVAAYLAERAAESDLRWAAAGRDRAKMERLLGELGVSGAETIAADVADPLSLARTAERTRVVLNLVGPYTLYGRPVIEACVEGGAHYADLTGEMPFVRTIIEDLHGRATAAGVKVVQVCGFEALPPDLLVALADERARERFGEGISEVEMEATLIPPPGLPRISDGMSGGTFQSLTTVAGSDQAGSIEDPAVLITDPAAAAAVRRVSPIGLAPRRGFSGAVIAPMAPAPFINPGVIHRTATLAAASNGRASQPFSYREGMALAGGLTSQPARWAIAGALSGMQIGLRSMARARPAVRRPLASAMSRLGPSSGFGPSAERLEGVALEDGAARAHAVRAPDLGAGRCGGSSRLSSNRAHVGRGGNAASRGGCHTRAQWLPDSGCGAWHGLGGALRTRTGTLLGQGLTRGLAWAPVLGFLLNSSLPKRLGRGLPIARLLLVGQVALMAGQHLSRIDGRERRRLATLVGRSRGRLSSLSAAERRELALIVAKLEPHLFMGTALRRLSPVPLPKRLLYGPRDSAARRALARHN